MPCAPRDRAGKTGEVDVSPDKTRVLRKSTKQRTLVSSLVPKTCHLNKLGSFHSVASARSSDSPLREKRTALKRASVDWRTSLGGRPAG